MHVNVFKQYTNDMRHDINEIQLYTVLSDRQFTYTMLNIKSLITLVLLILLIIFKVKVKIKLFQATRPTKWHRSPFLYPSATYTVRPWTRC